MRTTDLPFSTLRRLLLDLDFVEKTVTDTHIVFEHLPSESVFIFRPYKAKEKVNFADLITVKKQLDQRGLLEADAFDNLLRKVSA